MGTGTGFDANETRWQFQEEPDDFRPAQLLLQVGLVCRGVAILFRAFKGKPNGAIEALDDLNELFHRK